jgi:tRNA(Ile2) C34 agmatinyltransferase TiaS
MGMVHPCKVCNVETKYLYDEYYRCPRCGRLYGFIDEDIYDEIEKELNKKKVGRPKGSVNKNRLKRLGLLKGEKDEKNTR